MNENLSKEERVLHRVNDITFLGFNNCTIEHSNIVKFEKCTGDYGYGYDELFLTIQYSDGETKVNTHGNDIEFFDIREIIGVIREELS